MQIRATAGGVTGSATLTVRAPTSLAYGQTPAATITGTVALLEQFNGRGGPLVVTQSATGVYDVTLPGFVATNPAPRFIHVTSRNASVHCHPVQSPVNLTGGELRVRVGCAATATGAPANALFSVFAVGADGLPGRVAFAVTPQTNIGTGGFTPSSPFTRASRGTDADISVRRVDDVGRLHEFTFGALARQATDSAEVVFGASWDAVETWCATAFWTSSVLSAAAACHDAAGNRVNARVGVLILERGRAGRRFAVSWVDAPARAGAPEPLWTRSTGGAVSIAPVAGTVDATEVRFAGLAGSPNAPVAVLVGSYLGGSGVRACAHTETRRDGSDLVVRVACSPIGSASAPGLNRFSVAVVE